MKKNKSVLFEELKQFKILDKKLYIGNVNELKKDLFDTDNLYFAYLVHMVDNDDDLKKSDYKYLFEKIQYADIIFYRELFSGALLEEITLKKILSSRGMYVFNPIAYEDYVINVSFLGENDSQKKDNALMKVKVYR